MVLRNTRPLSDHITDCAHCGLPALAAFSDEDGAFCCAGCRVAYDLLNREGLLEFYELREQFSGDARPINVRQRQYSEFDEPEFYLKFSEPVAGGRLRTRLFCPDVHCAACVWVIEKLLMRRSGVIQVHVALADGSLEIEWNPAEIRLSEIVGQLAAVGYQAHAAIDHMRETVRRKQDRSLWLRLGVSGALAGNIMLLSVPLYTGQWYGIDPSFAALFQWASAAIGLIVVLYGAAPFHRAAFGGLRAGLIHIDLPISLGVSIAYLGSVLELLRGGQHVFFDSISGLVFFLLVGRVVLRRGRRRAESAVGSLLAIGDPSAMVVASDGSTQRVLADSLRIGDVIRVPVGGVLPVDGQVVAGQTHINNAVVTGESVPQRVAIGDSVVAGAMNLSGAIDVEANSVGAERRIAKIAELLRRADASRAPIIDLTDKIAGWFTVATLLASFTSGVVWFFLDSTQAIATAVAVAVVMCPCALGLATPLALAVAQGRASRLGIMVKNTEAIQRAAEVDTVAFDKTGTLTTGMPRLVGWLGQTMLEGVSLKNIVAAVEQYSAHPLALAFIADAEKSVDVAGVAIVDQQEVIGSGMRAEFRGHHLRIGSEAWIGQDTLAPWRGHKAFDATSTPVMIEVDGKVVAVALIGDRIHPNTKQAISELQALEIKPIILSGDQADAVQAVAGQSGIDEAYDRQTPETKLAYIQQHSRRRRIAMVGDGVNDSAALAAAHLAVAVHGAVDAALETADVYLVDAGTKKIVDLLELSRNAMQTVRRNLALSLTYNCIGLVLAASGTIGPLGAAILMPISSLSVVLSSIWSQPRDSGMRAQHLKDPL